HSSRITLIELFSPLIASGTLALAIPGRAATGVPSGSGSLESGWAATAPLEAVKKSAHGKLKHAPPLATRLPAMVGHALACQRPLAGASFLSFTASQGAVPRHQCYSRARIDCTTEAIPAPRKHPRNPRTALVDRRPHLPRHPDQLRQPAHHRGARAGHHRAVE